MASDGPGGGSEAVIAVRFAVSDPSYPFVAASDLGRLVLERMFPRDSGRYAEFFTVNGVDPDRIVERTRTDERIDARVIDRSGDGGLIEFTVTGDCPARDLAELGAIPQAAGSEDGEGWIEAEIPGTADAGAVVEQFLEKHPSIELVSKRTQSTLTPLFSEQELRRAVEQRLTSRQSEVLWTAYEAGFYDQPRATSGAAIADELGISGATFSQHRRAAERKLLGLVTGDVGSIGS